MSMQEVVGTVDKFSVSYEGLIDDVHEGSKILLDDGLIGLEVTKIDKANGKSTRSSTTVVPLKTKKVSTYQASQ